MGGIKLKVWGDYALFSRPEMKVERVSYDVITPSAARGIVEAVYFKPEIRWVIDAITVLNPIKFQHIKRNELLGTISMSKVKSAYLGNNEVELVQSTDAIVQRNSLILKDVAYIIEAHFELVKPKSERNYPEKHYAIVAERLKKGRCFHRPYLGCREFSANFADASKSNEHSYYANTQIDLGFMLWDIDFQNEMNPIFYRPTMKNGKILVPDLKGGDYSDTTSVM